MALHKGLVRMQSTDRVSGMSHVVRGINLCRLPSGLVCFGCCGFDFAKDLGDKKRFIESLKKSTEVFKKAKDKHIFKEMYDPEDLHDCGLCRMMVLTEKPHDKLHEQDKISVTCPLHPAENDGIEHRQGQCDYRYMCKTQRAFLREWDDATKERFLKFIEEKNPDWFTYSKGMHQGLFLDDFLKREE